MKIALYIEDGLEQIVLTPETETERGIIGKLSDGIARAVDQARQLLRVPRRLDALQASLHQRVRR
jgi:hypothetical protein